MAYNTVIADDEEIARSRLRRLLAGFPEITIVGEAKNGQEALELIQTLRPDLVFLDIEMPGKTGLEVATTCEHNPFIIFITAYSTYAVEAFKSLAVDYILKPIEKEQLEIAIQKFKRLKNPPDFNNIVSAVSERLRGSGKSRFRVSVGDSFKLIPFDQIICFEADQKYTTVHTVNSKFITEKTLTELEQELPSSTFTRIHRKHIINLDYVDEMKRWFDRKFKVVLNVPFDKELIVSRGYSDKIQNL